MNPINPNDRDIISSKEEIKKTDTDPVSKAALSQINGDQKSQTPSLSKKCKALSVGAPSLPQEDGIEEKKTALHKLALAYIKGIPALDSDFIDSRFNHFEDLLQRASEGLTPEQVSNMLEKIKTSPPENGTVVDNFMRLYILLNHCPYRSLEEISLVLEKMNSSILINQADENLFLILTSLSKCLPDKSLDKITDFLENILPYIPTDTHSESFYQLTNGLACIFNQRPLEDISTFFDLISTFIPKGTYIPEETDLLLSLIEASQERSKEELSALFEKASSFISEDFTHKQKTDLLISYLTASKGSSLDEVSEYLEIITDLKTYGNYSLEEEASAITELLGIPLKEASSIKEKIYALAHEDLTPDEIRVFYLKLIKNIKFINAKGDDLLKLIDKLLTLIPREATSSEKLSLLLYFTANLLFHPQEEIRTITENLKTLSTFLQTHYDLKEVLHVLHSLEGMPICRHLGFMETVLLCTNSYIPPEASMKKRAQALISLIKSSIAIRTRPSNTAEEIEEKIKKALGKRILWLKEQFFVEDLSKETRANFIATLIYIFPGESINKKGKEIESFINDCIDYMNKGISAETHYNFVISIIDCYQNDSDSLDLNSFLSEMTVKISPFIPEHIDIESRVKMLSNLVNLYSELDFDSPEPIPSSIYEECLKSELAALPMNTLSFTALTALYHGKEIPSASPSRLHRKATGLQELSENIELGKFKENIRRKMDIWKSLSEDDKLISMESSLKILFLHHIEGLNYSSLSINQKRLVIQEAQFLVTEKSTEEEKLEILSPLIKIAQNRNIDETHQLIKFIHSISREFDDMQKVQIIKALSHLPSPLANEDINQLTEYLKLIQSSDISTYLKKVILHDFITEIGTLSQKNLHDRLNQISKISPPKKQLITLILYCDKYKTNLTLLKSSINFILQEDLSIPLTIFYFDLLTREDLKETRFIHECAIRFIKKGIDQDHLDSVFFDLSQIPEAYRQRYTNLALSLFSPSSSPNERARILSIITTLKPLDSVLANHSQFPRYIVETINSFKEVAPEKALDISYAILELQKYSNLSVDNPAFILARDTILELETDKNKPEYVVLLAEKLKMDFPTSRIAETIEETELRLSTYDYKPKIKLNLSGLQASVQIVQGQSLNYEEFKEWLESRNQVHQKTNPGCPTLGPTVFKDLFANLRSRLKKQIQDNPKNKKEIQELDSEIENISTNFTNPSRLTYKIMNNPLLEGHEEVPQTTLRLYAIADAILSESSTLSSDETLTPQEVAMTTWLRLIEECSIGQSEGITACYSFLLASDRISIQTSKRSYVQVELTELYLANAVQKAMNTVLASPELLKTLEILDPGAINQGVHQSQYMGGVIGREAGIDREIKEDPYAGIIDPKLRTLDRETILRAFFTHLSLTLVDSLRSDVNDSIPELRTKHFDAISSFAMHHDLDMNQMWELKDSPPLILFKGSTKAVSITAERALTCARLYGDSDLWILPEEGSLHLTSKGVEMFRAHLTRNHEDTSLISNGSEITDQNSTTFLQFLKDHITTSLSEDLFSSSTKKLSEKGKEEFQKHAQDLSSPLKATLSGIFKRKASNNFNEKVKKNPSTYPSILLLIPPSEGLIDDINQLTEKGERWFSTELRKVNSDLKQEIERLFFEELPKYKEEHFETFLREQMEDIGNDFNTRNLFFKECIKNNPLLKNWSLENQPQTYELSEFGALTLLEQAGYLDRIL